MDKQEAKKILKEFHDKYAVFSVRTALETILPELKESEDEKIRKELIQYIKNWKANIQGKVYTYLWSSDKEECNKLLAWLEKQGKRDARYENLEELLEADTIYQMAMNDTMVEEAKTKAMNTLSELEIGKLLEIGKQGEQKETICDKCKKEQPSHSCQDITSLGRCALEKQGERIKLLLKRAKTHKT